MEEWSEISSAKKLGQCSCLLLVVCLLDHDGTLVQVSVKFIIIFKEQKSKTEIERDIPQAQMKANHPQAPVFPNLNPRPLV
jgi:hypothetical protein